MLKKCMYGLVGAVLGLLACAIWFGLNPVYPCPAGTYDLTEQEKFISGAESGIMCLGIPASLAGVLLGLCLGALIGFLRGKPW
jgi:hypothetical protein